MGGDSWLNFLFSSEGEVQSELLRGVGWGGQTLLRSGDVEHDGRRGVA